MNLKVNTFSFSNSVFATQPFNQYLQEHGNQLEGTIADSNQSGADILAAKLVGRWKNGLPLILEPTNPNTKSPEANDFNYADDRTGIRCPLSAHIRVTNPRANKDLEAVSQPLRPLIRRGVPYGSQLNPPDSNTEDGIALLCHFPRLKSSRNRI